MKTHIFSVLVGLFLVLLIVPPAAEAGTTSGFVNITAVEVHVDGTWLINISQATTGAPSCVTSGNPPVTNRLSGTVASEGGKALLRFAEAAFLAGTKVQVTGTNNCSEFPGIESVFSISGVH